MLKQICTRKSKQRTWTPCFLWTCIKTQITALYIPLNSTQNVHFYCALLLNYNKNSLLLDYEKVALHQNTLLTDNKHALSSMFREKTKLWSLKWHSLSIVYSVLTISIYIDVTFFCLSNCMSLNTLTFFNNSSEQTLVSCRISEK